MLYGLRPICDAAKSKAVPRSCAGAIPPPPVTYAAVAAPLASQPAPDAEIETYLARETKFDPDLWIVEVEDRAGRNFLNIVR